MRTELISQDYSAFSGFAFEPLPEKKKITPEPETEVAAKESATAPEKEDISLAVQDIDAAGLDFEFESHALAASLPEFALENKYYTIGEVAALFVVNVSHIRFWTTEFNLKVRTTRKGDRLYNPENIARLRLIHHLVKENGFTIKGAKDKLKHQKQNVSAQIDLKNKLSGLKDKLERIKKNL
ncbi:MAG: MerR family transcriptional regulator [Sphingobacteriales bacterium]|nr:MAG: MerR family transcriptional regulator [Sphingobacteriales bacterium]